MCWQVVQRACCRLSAFFPLTQPSPPHPLAPSAQLACEGDIAHVVVMPNITIRKLETFVQELVESR